MDLIGLVGTTGCRVTREGSPEGDEAENEYNRLMVEGDVCRLIFTSAMPCEVESISVVTSFLGKLENDEECLPADSFPNKLIWLVSPNWLLELLLVTVIVEGTREYVSLIRLE